MRSFPPPGFYSFPEDNGVLPQRVQLVTGTTKGNMWFDREDTDGRWTTLLWTCVLTLKEIQEQGWVFSSEPPEGVPAL